MTRNTSFLISALICLLLYQHPGLAPAWPPVSPVFSAAPGLSIANPLVQTQPLTGTASATGLAWQSYLSVSTIHALLATDETIWAATDGGVLRWDREEGAYLSYTSDDGLISNDVTALAMDQAGHLWVGVWNGVSEFDGQRWTTYTRADGLAGERVYAMAIDPAGAKWFGTDGGVSKFDGQSWTSYTTADGLAGNYVQAMAIDPAGHPWFGTVGNGVSRFDGQSWTTYTTADGLASDFVNAIVVDPAGPLWFGTGGGGVSQLDGQSWTTYTAADGLASNVVLTLALDEAGHLWAGSSGGLSRFDGLKWTSYTRREGLLYSRIQALAIDPAGHKWLGFGEGGAGVIEFDERQWMASPPALPALVVTPAASLASATVEISGPRLVDEQADRSYARGSVDGIEKTLVLASADERLLATYSLVGELALDSTHQRLYIDQSQAGLAVVNTRTERLDNLIFLPKGSPYTSLPAPQADPTSGHVLAFRDNVAYLIDPATGAIVDTLTSDFPLETV